MLKTIQQTRLVKTRVVKYYIVYCVNYISTCMKDGDMKTRGNLRNQWKKCSIKVFSTDLFVLFFIPYNKIKKQLCAI